MSDSTARMPDNSAPQSFQVEATQHLNDEQVQDTAREAQSVRPTPRIPNTEELVTLPNAVAEAAHQGQTAERELDDLMAPHAPGAIVTGNTCLLNDVRYSILEQLGQASGEAVVYKIQDPEHRLFVLKYYMPGIRPKSEILDTLMQLQHEDIVRVLDYGFYQDRFYELLEYAAGGDLLQYAPIRELSHMEAIVAQTVSALHFCHGQQIVHRDIKPGNIFYRDAETQNIIIGDFGISSKISEDEQNKLTTQNRSPIYAAPEIYQSVQGKVVIKKEIDYYSLGITLIYLWTGQVPFKGFSEFQIMDAKFKGHIPIPEDMPRRIQQLIRGLLSFNPEKRWGHPEVQRWLAGESVPVFSLQPEQQFQAFKFGHDASGQALEAHSSQQLAQLMESDPEKGKKFLSQGAIKSWLEHNGEHATALALQDIVENETAEQGFWEALYCLDPERLYTSPAGKVCQSLEDIAEAMAQEFSAYGLELQRGHSELWAYLRHCGLNTLCQELQAALTQYSHRSELMALAVLYRLHPDKPYALSPEIQVTSPRELAELIYQGDWSQTQGPEHYNLAQAQLNQGQLLVWLEAIGQGDLVRQLKTQTYASDDQQMEVFIRLLKPETPDIQVKFEAQPLPKHQGRGIMREFIFNYNTLGPGIPYIEIESPPAVICSSNVITTRQGQLQILVDSSRVRKVDQLQQLQIQLKPHGPLHIQSGDHLKISYQKSYPWKRVLQRGCYLGGVCALSALAFRALLAYKYPKFLSAYFGYQFTRQQAQGFSDNALIYICLAGLVMTVLTALWLKKKMRSVP